MIQEGKKEAGGMQYLKDHWQPLEAQDWQNRVFPWATSDLKN